MSQKFWEQVEQVKAYLKEGKQLEAFELTQEIKEKFKLEFENNNDILIFQKEILDYDSKLFLNLDLKNETEPLNILILISMLSIHHDYNYEWLEANFSVISDDIKQLPSWRDPFVAKLLLQRSFSKEDSFFIKLKEEEIFHNLSSNEIYEAFDINSNQEINIQAVHTFFNHFPKSINICSYLCLLKKRILKTFLPAIVQYCESFSIDEIKKLTDRQFLQEQVNDLKQINEHQIDEDCFLEFNQTLEKLLVQKELQIKLEKHPIYKINKI